MVTSALFSLYQQNEDSEDIKSVLHSVGLSPVFGEACLLRLSRHVQEFAASLKPVAKGIHFFEILLCYLNLNTGKGTGEFVMMKGKNGWIEIKMLK